jgi:hypothetical protein
MKLPIFLLATATLAFAGPETPFNGKDLTGWEFKNKAAAKWTVGEATMSASDSKLLEVKPGDGALVNVVAGHNQSHDIYSTEKYGDMRLELEVMVPKGSNSGIYVMGEYEVQVFDSHGKKDMTPGDMGAIYSAAVPKVNASKAPGEWQKYVIEFRAPKFDEKGNKTKNAVFVKVELNGTVLHENVEMKGPTPGGLTGREAATAPIMFQGDHGAVAYRNIRISPLK